MSSKINQPGAPASSTGIYANPAPEATTYTAPAPGPTAAEGVAAVIASGRTSADSSQSGWINQEDLKKAVGQLPQTFKNFGNRTAEQFNSLSTAQKVASGVGGALLVGGLGWLALRGKSQKPLAGSANAKWNESSGSVYRGAAAGLHEDSGY